GGLGSRFERLDTRREAAGRRPLRKDDDGMDRLRALVEPGDFAFEARREVPHASRRKIGLEVAEGAGRDGDAGLGEGLRSGFLDGEEAPEAHAPGESRALPFRHVAREPLVLRGGVLPGAQRELRRGEIDDVVADESRGSVPRAHAVADWRAWSASSALFSRICRTSATFCSSTGMRSPEWLATSSATRSRVRFVLSRRRREICW